MPFVARALSLLLALAGSTPSPAGDPVDVIDPSDLLPDAEIVESLVLAPTSGPQRYRHRGDWEPSNTLLISYSGYWEDSLSELMRAALDEAEVYVLVPRGERSEAYAWVRREGYDRRRVHMVRVQLDTPWVRDYGPLQVTDARGRVRWLDAGYSGARPADDRLPTNLARRVGMPVEPLDITLDGGGIISNGDGLCVITRDTLEDTGMSPEDEDAHDVILSKLGCAAMAIVPALANEATGHVDMFAQFVTSRRLLLAEVNGDRWEEDRTRLEEALRGVKQAAKRLGQELEIVRVPLPMPAYDLYRSYVNGLRLANSFLVPSYGDVDPDTESRALEILQGAMPDVRVVPIPADRMIELEGAIHCVTQALQLPKRRPKLVRRRSIPKRRRG